LVEYEKRGNSKGLVLEVEIRRYNKEINCILIERISGNSIDFIEEYNRIRDYVFDEL
jgi:hypothetical protein